MWVLVVMASLTAGGRGASTARCPQSPILFAFGGSLFRMESGKTPVEIAQGFKEPHDLAWAPNCENYAFIESGSLWIGAAGEPAVKVATPWQVLEYVWSPDGEAIASAVDSSTAFTRQSFDPGDLITLSPRTKKWRALTDDGKNHLLGWSDDGKSLLIRKEVSTPCDPKAHECARGDVVILELASGLQKTLLTAQKLNEDGWADPHFLGWEARKGILYIESQVSPIGGINVLAAVQVPSAEILWSMGCYDADYLGDGLIATQDRQPEDYEETGLNWSLKYKIIRGGKVATDFPPLPSDLDDSAGPVSPNGKYVLWDVPDNDHQVWRVHFATTATASAWSFELPQGYEPIAMVWTPGDVAVVGSYCERPQGERLFDLFTLDPQKKEARRFFHQAKVVPGAGPDARILALGGGVPGPDGQLRWVHPILQVARWAR